MKKLARSVVVVIVALVTMVVNVPTADAASWRAVESYGVCGPSVFLRAGTYAQVCAIMENDRGEPLTKRHLNVRVIIRQSGGSANVSVSTTQAVRPYYRSDGRWFGPWQHVRTGSCNTRTFYSRTSQMCQGDWRSVASGWNLGADIVLIGQATITVNGVQYYLQSPRAYAYV